MPSFHALNNAFSMIDVPTLKYQRWSLLQTDTTDIVQLLFFYFLVFPFQWFIGFAFVKYDLNWTFACISTNLPWTPSYTLTRFSLKHLQVQQYAILSYNDSQHFFNDSHEGQIFLRMKPKQNNATIPHTTLTTIVIILFLFLSR